MAEFKITFAVQGRHVHCKLYAKPPGSTWNYLGVFVAARGPEFEALVRAMSGVAFIGTTPGQGLERAYQLDDTTEQPHGQA